MPVGSFQKASGVGVIFQKTARCMAYSQGASLSMASQFCVHRIGATSVFSFLSFTTEKL